jgi:hypothetical protein
MAAAQAQTTPNLALPNPPGMSTPPDYSHVVEVNGSPWSALAEVAGLPRPNVKSVL